MITAEEVVRRIQFYIVGGIVRPANYVRSLPSTLSRAGRE